MILHALLLATTDLRSMLHEDSDKKQWFQGIEGFIIDEATMLDFSMMNLLMELAQQYPSRPERRRPGSLPHFGHRSVLLCGDLRQDPPTSPDHAQLFWSSATFSSFF